MAKEKKSAKEIVEESLPGIEVVAAAAPVADSVRRATRPGPSLAELRKKYLGADEGEDDAGGSEAAPAEESDIEVMKVRARKAPADPADDPGQRTVIVSKKKGVIGTQG